MLRRTLLAAAGSLLAGPALARAQSPEVPAEPFKAAPAGPRPSARKSAWAEIDGLRSYYELHGPERSDNPPLVVLHGGLMTIDAFGPLLPALAADRPVIAVELEGHGRTRDLDRPLSLDQMAADLGALLDQLKVRQADVFGFSMGGGVALRLAARRPELVRRQVVVSAATSNDGFYPSVTAMWPGLSAEGMRGTPMEQVYMAVAPDKAHWPVFIDKMRQMMTTTPPLADAEIAAIKAPTLLVIADADLIRPEAAIALFRKLGGAPEHGGMGPLPASRLAVIPGATHFDIIYRVDMLAPMTAAFLDASVGPAAAAPGV